MKRILLSVPHMGGREQIYGLEAFATNWLSTVGPNLTAFECEFEARVGAPAVALASGTAALHPASCLVGVGPGDEVLCSTLTFVAAANAIVYQGGVPVFVDSDRATWNLGSDVLSRALRERRRRTGFPRRWWWSTSMANIQMLINRGRGYKNVRCLLLKAERMAVTNAEFVAVHRVKKAA